MRNRPDENQDYANLILILGFMSDTTYFAMINLSVLLFYYLIFRAAPRIITEEVNQYGQSKANLIDSLKRQLRSARTNIERLNIAGFPDELVPNEFRCAISNGIMDRPVKLTLTNQLYDWSHLYSWLVSSDGIQNPRRIGHNHLLFEFRNIGNNQLVSYPKDVHDQFILRTKIDLFVKTAIEQIIALRQTRSQRFFQADSQLNDDDFRIIKEHAMSVINQVTQDQSPALTPRR